VSEETSDSAGIVFEAEAVSGKDVQTKKFDTLERRALAPKIEQFMYIQMEYCEKSTLR
jgi:hypothetical protein